MITFIILVILGVLGWVLFEYSIDFDDIGVIVMFLSVVLLFIHLIVISQVSVSYETKAAEAEAIQWTLDQARNSGNELELATITKTVVEFNSSLAKEKAYNRHWFYDQYVDDRIINIGLIR